MLVNWQKIYSYHSNNHTQNTHTNAVQTQLFEIRISFASFAHSLANHGRECHLNEKNRQQQQKYVKKQQPKPVVVTLSTKHRWKQKRIDNVHDWCAIGWHICFLFSIVWSHTHTRQRQKYNKSSLNVTIIITITFFMFSSEKKDRSRCKRAKMIQSGKWWRAGAMRWCHEFQWINNVLSMLLWAGVHTHMDKHQQQQHSDWQKKIAVIRWFFNNRNTHTHTIDTNNRLWQPHFFEHKTLHFSGETWRTRRTFQNKKRSTWIIIT